MLIKRISGATRLVGQAQGYIGLPLRDELVEDTTTGKTHNAMTSAWEPTPAEIERLQGGASVHVKIFGTTHPPIIVTVGDAIEEDA